MFPFPHLTELGSSWTHVLLALGAGLILPSVVDPANNRHRAALMGISFLLALRYVWWRGTETLAPAGWTIDMLARARLIARRDGCQLFLADASLELRELLELAGLTGAVPCEEVSALDAEGEPERGKETRGIQEERDPADPAA